MKRITVYADFDFLTSTEEIGTLGYEHVRGKDHFVFEYSRQWLKQHGGILLSGDLMNVPSLQHPRGNDNVFGFVKDSFPDRWGRLLLDRRERLTAQQEGRPKLWSVGLLAVMGLPCAWGQLQMAEHGPERRGFGRAGIDAETYAAASVVQVADAHLREADAVIGTLYTIVVLTA